jgi:hypothetical protein
VLFDGPRADAQVAREFFVAASLHQQTQYLLVSGRYLDIVEVDHLAFRRLLQFSLGVATRRKQKQPIRQIFAT